MYLFLLLALTPREKFYSSGSYRFIWRANKVGNQSPVAGRRADDQRSAKRSTKTGAPTTSSCFSVQYGPPVDG